MSPSGSRFEPNPNLMRDLKRDYDAAAQRVVDDLAATREGRSLDATKAALAARLAPAIQLPEGVLTEWAQAIVDGDPIKVDLHLQ